MLSLYEYKGFHLPHEKKVKSTLSNFLNFLEN
jgi:hypothetical protein